MVVDKNDVTCFMHPDAKRHDDFSGNTRPSGDISKMVESKGLAMRSDSLKCRNTRFFYSAAVDRKCVEGLLARGKKASVVAKHFSKPIKVNGTVFVARFEPRSANTSGDKLLHENPPPSIVVGQDNGNSSPIVSRKPKSRTSGPNKRGGNNCFALNNGVNGHIHDAHNDLYNGSVALMDSKNNGLLASNTVARTWTTMVNLILCIEVSTTLIAPKVHLYQIFLGHVKVWVHLTICVIRCYCMMLTLILVMKMLSYQMLCC